MERELSHNSDEMVTGNPLVSVVIPVYNASRYLRESVDSVISQTYQNLEIIIVDDGSTDDSGSICDKYAENDSRIIVIHSENRGLSAARNLGMSKMSGSYICFLDSDDWIDSRAIETLLKTAVEKKSDIVAAETCYEYVDQTRHPKAKNTSVQVFSGQGILQAFVDKRIGDEVWDKIYRTECFEDIRFPVGQNFEDVATTYRVLMKLAENDGTVTVIPDELIHCRIRKSSISHTWTLKNVKDCWKSFHTKYEALPAYQDKLLSGCFAAIGYMWLNYRSFSKKDKARAGKTIREMQMFSKKHFHQVMKGNYSKSTKIACILSQKRSPAMMLAGSCAKTVRQVIGSSRRKMYD